ncbi:ribosome maturation factor RimP [Nevskia soli]|jgi:ribosome maturation factor RimP|uniref:ribosome maturation factor RimP n=1 Tax=Nevskia soli TaxID=418856 RepID=UPI0015D8E745|nr:ribosome maturation factor RimP [Nevskia soli]
MGAISRQTTVARVEQLAERAAETEHIEIVEVELKGSGRNQLVRISIDKPQGVTHGDCERMSHALSALLDAENILPDQYTLEVSSPGVERKLKKPRDFERFQGQKAKLVLKQGEGAERKSRFVEGTLAGTENAGVLLDVPGGERLHIAYEQIDRANLKFEW